MKLGVFSLSLGILTAGQSAVLVAKPAAPRDQDAAEVRELMLEATDPQNSMSLKNLATEKLLAYLEINQSLEGLLPDRVITTPEASRYQTWRKLLISGLAPMDPSETRRRIASLRSPDIIVVQQGLRALIRNLAAKQGPTASPLAPLEAARFGLQIEELIPQIESIYQKSTRIRPALVFTLENSDITPERLRSALMTND